MLEALGSALSGIRLGTTTLEVAAANVANARTPGFEPKAVVGTERAGGGVEPLVIEGVDDGPAADLVAAMLARHTVSLNAAVARRADAVQGQLVDILG